MLNQIAAIHGVGTPAVTNSYESIATVLVGSGGTGSISFSSIPSTFKHLQIRAIARELDGGQTNASQQIVIRLNSDSGSNYAIHRLVGDGSGAGADGYSSQTNMAATGIPGNSTTASVFGASIIDILDYQNTNKNKTMRTLTGTDLNGSGAIWFSSGLWQSTSAVNAITLTALSSRNFAQYSHFALYGIKG